MNYNPYQTTLADLISNHLPEFFGAIGLLVVAAFWIGCIWTNQRKQRYDFEELKKENKEEHGAIADEMQEVKSDLAEAKVERAEMRGDIKVIKSAVLNGRSEKEVSDYTTIHKPAK